MMPFWYSATMLMLVLVTVATRSCFLLTLTTLVPISNRIAAWPGHR